ncbi:MAG: hypothetical protein LBI74_10650 [Synergistaceae bacterium]|nr:hypothetical protein [Synergistaceae bacterium]
MTELNAEEKKIRIENSGIRTVIDYSEGVVFEEFSNLPSGRMTNRDRELFVIEIYGKEYTSGDFKIESVKIAQDKIQELVTLSMELPAERLKARVHIINDRKNKITVLYQIRDDYKTGAPSVSFLRIPLLAGLEAHNGDDYHYYPSGVVLTEKGRDVMIPMAESFHGADILMPLVVCDSDDRYGFSVQFPSPSDLNDAGATQNANKQLTAISCSQELQNHRLRINPDPSFNDTVELCILGLSGGWSEAFGDCRATWQSRYDFSEYDRDDLQWFSECVVHNFVFLYGKEGFDHEKQKIDVDKLLMRGDEFGGYDTVTIWNQYPRLGVDARTQWDFYDDFPGGREALKEAVQRFHDRGVAVFLPYIPWDRGKDETTDSMGDEFARVIADTGADGYQLDTLWDLPFSYRKKLDGVRTGLVLTTQHHPMKKHPVEFVTTSWDEFWSFDPMPEVDVFRFMCPRHISPVISRWLRLEDKTILIKRCEFGAAPIVIWQDIFGRWMPFSEDQKERVKRWKDTYLKHRGIYQGGHPIPLYPTRTRGVYCNLFADDNTEDQIYSFYNDNEKTCTVEKLSVRGIYADTAEIILGDGDVSLGQDAFAVRIASKEVLHLLVRAGRR